MIAAALRAGLAPADLLHKVKAYAKESEGYTRRKVCFSNYWFEVRRWEKALAQMQADRGKAREAEVNGRTRLVSRIHERHPMYRHLTNR